MVTAMNPNETPCIDPATGVIYGNEPLDTVEGLLDAIAASHKAQKTWAAVAVGDRKRAMFRVRDYLAQNAEQLATTISRDNGKTRVDALSTEVLPAAMATNYYAKNAARFLKPRKLSPGNVLMMNKRGTIYHFPFGVIGIISPWNYPFGIPFHEVVKALLAGNGVILKVASESVAVGRAIAECFAAASLPEGLFAHINLPGRVAGDAMLEGGIDKLFFTGSVAVGKKLMVKAAETLTPVSLELGGNDAMLVCKDADLSRAAAGAVWAGLQNCGQSCGGVERIYVHKDVYEPFLAKLATRVRALRHGPDIDFEVDLGAVTTDRQAETIRAHVDDALERGATVFAQTEIPTSGGGRFVPAMILTDVNHEMRVMREETFGPLLGVMKVEDMDEAIALANDSDLGLSGSVWSRNGRRAIELARRMEAGAIMINDHLMSHGLAETPWGGFKQSGIGRTHGEIGFGEMTEPQCIITDQMGFLKKNMWWYPHGAEMFKGMLGVTEALYGRGLGRRLGGLWRTIKLFLGTLRG